MFYFLYNLFFFSYYYESKRLKKSTSIGFILEKTRCFYKNHACKNSISGIRKETVNILDSLITKNYLLKDDDDDN